MAQTTRIEILVPSEADLEVQDSVPCTFDGCNRVFKSPASRAMHIARHHEGKRLESTGNNRISVDTIYYCPVSGCSRSKETANKPFKKLGQVKQHYNLVHREKQYECGKCGKKFGMKDAYQRHVKECGIVFTCQVCELELKSSNALYQHCKRSGHMFQERKKPNPPTTQPNVIIAPLIIKTVLPLPTSSSSSTNSSCSNCSQDKYEQSNSNDTMTTMEDTSKEILQQSATQTEVTGYEFFPLATITTSTHDKITKDSQTNPLLQCEFGTQTMPLLSDSWPRPFNEFSDLFDAETMDFGTQTLDTTIFHEDLGIQTYNPTKDQSSQT